MKYFKNTSWLFVEKILRMIVGLFVGIWVARYLGPEQFGLLSYAQSFVGLFAVIATLGLDGIVVRELVKNESRRDKLIGTTFWLKLMGAFGVLTLLTIAINFTSNDTYTNTLVFIVASATIFQSFNVIDLYFQSKVISRYAVYANIISLFISSFVKVVLILNESPLITFAWVVLFDSVVLAWGFIYFYFRNSLSMKQWKFDRMIAMDLLRDSWPLILSGIAISIYTKIDQVMIKEMLDSQAVGQYAAAVRLSGGWYFIPMVIASSLFPAVINAKKQSEELYYARLQKLYDLMVWIGIFLVIPLWYFSEPIMITLFGVEYSSAVNVFEITILNVVLICIAAIHGKWLLVEGLQKYSLFYSLMGMITNIVTNFYLIPKIGIIGAAYGTVLAQIVPYVLLLRNSKTRDHLSMILGSLIPLHLIKGK